MAATATLPQALASQPRPVQFYDLPFIYTYDADALTPGASYNYVAVPVTNDSDFLLRRVAGVPNVAESWRMRDSIMRDRMAGLIPVAQLAEWPVVPEMVFRSEAQISFDLANVALGSNLEVAGATPTYYYSQIAFQGVRRYYNRTTPGSTYPFYHSPHQIMVDATIDRAGCQSPGYTLPSLPVSGTVLIENYDFDMEGVSLVLTPVRSGPVVCRYKVKVMLYDPNYLGLMTAPVVDDYLNLNSAGRNSVFPAPSVLYPAGSLIRFEITSLLISTEVPATLTLTFVGKQRRPCR